MLAHLKRGTFKHVSLASLLDVEIKCRMLPKAVRELDQNEIVVFAFRVKFSQTNSNLILIMVVFNLLVMILQNSDKQFLPYLQKTNYALFYSAYYFMVLLIAILIW